MTTKSFHHSELILNPDGSIYHLHLRPEHIAPTVILVGDQGRVALISKHFDSLELEIQNREFLTHTGTYHGHRITVTSSGIGTDNMDILITEIDAVINIDLNTRGPKKERRSLNFIRIGTSSALHPDIPVGSFVISQFGLGFDGLLHYYDFKYSQQEELLTKKIIDHLTWNKKLSEPYVVESSPILFAKLGNGMVPGITATASGFYGPQGRHLTSQPSDPDLNNKLISFHQSDLRITNYEMETSAMYGLGKMLGHQCCTCCAIIANRSTRTFSKNYQIIVDSLIKTVLDRITTP